MNELLMQNSGEGSMRQKKKVGGVLVMALLIVCCGIIVTTNSWVEQAKTKSGELVQLVLNNVSVGAACCTNRVANPAKGESLIMSVANAAKIFSVKVGGGGEEMFPTNALEISQYMPPVVARATVGCYSSEVQSLGGYVCHYSAEKDRTDFNCTAVPANGYRGDVFRVHKNLKIVCLGTNGVDRITSDMP